MRLIVETFLALAIAALGGLALTYAAVEHPPAFMEIRSGAWVAQPSLSVDGVHPYALAGIAKRATVPLAPGDGIALTAETDDEGRSIEGDCDYRVAGIVPAARAWTIAARSPDGEPFPNPAERFVFTDTELMRDQSRRVEIMLSSHPQPGDWLPLAAGRRATLVLRLYDTPVTAAISRRAVELPAITRLGCT